MLSLHSKHRYNIMEGYPCQWSITLVQYHKKQRLEFQTLNLFDQGANDKSCDFFS